MKYLVIMTVYFFYSSCFQAHSYLTNVDFNSDVRHFINKYYTLFIVVKKFEMCSIFIETFGITKMILKNSANFKNF